MTERPEPLGGRDASSAGWSEAGRTALLDTAAPLDFGEVAGAAVTDQEMASATNDQFVEATNFSHDPASLDRLAEHGDGQLAPNIARNSLYVKFDPLLGRPSVLPELARFAACAEGPAPGMPRQLVSVKSDVIAFSPGKEPAEPTPTPPATVAFAPASDLSSATPPTSAAVAAAAAAAAAADVSQLLKNHELKNARAKLILQACNKTEKLVEQMIHLVKMLTNENGQLRRELKTRLLQLAAERDEARQEGAIAEAMFVDIWGLERENREITAIFDELIQKMGGAH